MYGLLGEKLGYSFSKTIHERLWADDYNLLAMNREELDAFLLAREFSGVNVTIPYKQIAVGYCNEIDKNARAIGCVNTIVNHGGRLLGYNTDFDGFAYCLRRAGIQLSGKRVLILGSGSTSLTLRAVALAQGAAAVERLSREGELNYQNAHRFSNPQIILNATPVGMYPAVSAQAVDLRDFPTVEAVADVVYNPLRSDLVLQAQSLGLPACGGLGMLVAQAAFAAKLFCGRDFSDDEIEAVLAEIEKEKTNLVLVGMPGCGKSSVGALLAERLGRPLVDIDSEIVRRTGKSIPEIFATRGEETFRDWEELVLAEVSSQNGQIIATGGGAVLRTENRRVLRRNGRIYFLHRALSTLPTDGRPLSLGGRLESLYQARLPLYEEAAHATIDNNGTLEATLAAILEDFS